MLLYSVFRNENSKKLYLMQQHNVLGWKSKSPDFNEPNELSESISYIVLDYLLSVFFFITELVVLFNVYLAAVVPKSIRFMCVFMLTVCSCMLSSVFLDGPVRVCT